MSKKARRVVPAKETKPKEMGLADWLETVKDVEGSDPYKLDAVRHAVTHVFTYCPAARIVCSEDDGSEVQVSIAFPLK